MTKLTENVERVNGVPDPSPWIFFSEAIRETALGQQLITTQQVRVAPVNGVISVDLAPGPAVVSFSGGVYGFTVPYADSRIWPLISGTPVSPGESTLSLTDDGTGEFILGYAGIGITLTDDDGDGEFVLTSGGNTTLTDDGTGLFSIGP